MAESTEQQNLELLDRTFNLSNTLVSLESPDSEVLQCLFRYFKSLANTTDFLLTEQDLVEKKL